MEKEKAFKIKEKLRTVEMNCIKKKLNEKGVSQKWVAERMNKTNNTLNSWCANRVQPHLSDLYMLSAILNCPVKDLISDIDLKELLSVEE